MRSLILMLMLIAAASIVSLTAQAAHAADEFGSPEDLLFQETTTLGIRKQEIDRLVLDRDRIVLDTPWGSIRVKVGRRGGATLSAEPEYDDLRQAARQSGLPIKELHRRVLEQYHARGTQNETPER